MQGTSTRFALLKASLGPIMFSGRTHLSTSASVRKPRARAACLRGVPSSCAFLATYSVKDIYVSRGGPSDPRCSISLLACSPLLVGAGAALSGEQPAAPVLPVLRVVHLLEWWGGDG